VAHVGPSPLLDPWSQLWQSTVRLSDLCLSNSLSTALRAMATMDAAVGGTTMRGPMPGHSAWKMRVLTPTPLDKPEELATANTKNLKVKLRPLVKL
jgi:hypothetical protein